MQQIKKKTGQSDVGLLCHFKCIFDFNAPRARMTCITSISQFSELKGHHA
ncbi:hypothetical protein BLL52_0388 [Rhodoferax antarcticus ANT.BR]|uniref:Uncharacterized protein n=1 Tax=Rhodoferax antarcticus ANT.BR TaxID=1111071 RepID=A0A1Q8YJM3_9BURK|nr:hypothetical protein BLL52_0388 [Rhodoferax antarcticus ANT.BR]